MQDEISRNLDPDSRRILNALTILFSVCLFHWNSLSEAIEQAQLAASWKKYYKRPITWGYEAINGFVDDIGKVASEDLTTPAAEKLIHSILSEMHTRFRLELDVLQFPEYQAIIDIFKELLDVLNCQPLVIPAPELLGVDPLHPNEPGMDLVQRGYQFAEDVSLQFYSHSTAGQPAHPEKAPLHVCTPPRNTLYGWQCLNRIIEFNFITNRFTSCDYLNLPFYVFHEWASHAHSAPMFANQNGQKGRFEDGWLLHAEELFFKKEVLSRPQQQMDPLRRALDTYIDSVTSSSALIDKAPEAYAYKRGYDIACNFYFYILEQDDERFLKISADLANLPYDHIPDHSDLHLNFMIAIDHAYRIDASDLKILASSLESQEFIQTVIKKYYIRRNPGWKSPVN